MTDVRPGRLFARADDVVWRIAADRVIVRRPADAPSTTAIPGHLRTDADEASDLLGDAALAWTALDTPATLGTLEQRLGDAGLDRGRDPGFSEAVAALVAAGWLVEVDP